MIIININTKNNCIIKQINYFKLFKYIVMSSGDDSDDGKKHLLKLNPSKFQKVTSYV